MSADIKTDSRFSRSLFQKSMVQSVLGVPLQIEGTTIGTLIVLRGQSHADSLEVALAYLVRFANVVTPYLRNVQKIQEYFEVRLPESSLRSKYEALGLLGTSKDFMGLLHAIEAAARCDVRVLLEGQSGTGKELVARAIHKLSGRHSKSFVAIDCGAIPPNLIESELFGHVRGAFSGATTDRKGLMEEAHQGTLFMDEITNLPLEMQTKLLRVLQEGEIRPLGSNKTRTVDIRIIAASSISLQKLVDDEAFREDLFYRLYVYPIHVPSLNERQNDIPLLAAHFLTRCASQQQKQAGSCHEEVLDFLQHRHWKGNVRELENIVERLVTLAPIESKIIGREILPPDLMKELKNLDTSSEDHTIPKSLTESLHEFEEEIIRKALAANQWNQSKAARALKTSEQTLRYKMSKLDIVSPRTQVCGNE